VNLQKSQLPIRKNGICFTGKVRKGKDAYGSSWIGNPSQSNGASGALVFILGYFTAPYKWSYYYYYYYIGSHSVTCHPTQVNAPCLNPSHAGWYLIYLPWRDGRLS